MLKSRLQSLEKSLDSLYKLVTSIEPANDFGPVETPLNALSDIAKLCHAHTTKLGIAFKPPISQDAAEKTLEDWSKMPVNFVAAYLSLLKESSNDRGDLVIAEMRRIIMNIISVYTSLIENLIKTVDSKKKSTASDELTLQLIGQIWASCDSIVKIAGHDLSDLVAEQLKTFVAYAQDAKNEMVPGNTEDGPDYDDSYDDNLAKLSPEQVQSALAKLSDIISVWELVIKDMCNGQLTVHQYRSLWSKSKVLSELIDDFVCEVNEGSWDKEVYESLDREFLEVLNILDIDEKDQSSAGTVISKLKASYKK